eukprot:1936828-Pleurochrysis_carterae.AAC.1
MGLSGPRRSAAHDAPWRCVRAVAHRCVCIGRKRGAIGQVVWLSMCKRGRCTLNKYTRGNTTCYT